MPKHFSRTYQDYITGPVWRRQRLKALMKWGRYCSACGESRHVEVHHLAYRNLHDVTPDDLMPLCKTHHDLCHGHPELVDVISACASPAKKREAIIAFIRQTKRKHVCVSAPKVIRREPAKPLITLEELERRAELKRQLIASNAEFARRHSLACQEKALVLKRERVVELGLATEQKAATMTITALRRRIAKFGKQKKKESFAASERALAIIRANPGATTLRIW